ncbi:HAMP domain-containing protein [Jiangella aurantiaca]|uniref:histidine kinase n=1 Tax=Jiangella aurantiaca TaxID=2530373 RepID=A0A4R5A6E4_9ACTN|nr:ATP-binding protein [Jiangella aurantiaca]TDD67501.1 HAMP domain-containing protein [Jiangella aurantiaca]
MRLLPRSLRARLTLVGTLGAAAVVAACVVALYVALDSELRSTLDAGLEARSDDLVAAVRSGQEADVQLDPLAQLYDADGTLLAGSPSLRDGRLLGPGEVRDSVDGELVTRTLPVGPDGAATPVRLLVRQADPQRVLVVGAPAEAVETARERLFLVLFIAAPLLVVVLAAAGWLVARAALRPVDLLTREAAAISTLEAERRLPAVAGDDEIARLARTLDDMLGRLRVAFAREQGFVDDASHELRTPIAILQGELELAMSAADDPAEVRRSLQAALREAARLARLAEDLLLLARQRAGSLVITSEPVDLLEIARDHTRNLESVLDIRIAVEGDPVVVEADPRQLRQVLSNLAGNSAAAGAATVRVRIERRHDAVIVEVADDGPGFAPNVLRSAFDRFVRGDDARTRGSSGAGLGLSIVRAIVTAHGGTIDARNDGPLGGAVVTARLPALGPDRRS